MQYLNDKIYSEFTKIKSDTKKRNSEFSEMKSDTNDIKTMFTHMMSQKQNSSPGNMDSLKAHDTDTVVPTNKKSPPLEGGHYMKIGCLWNLKHEIRSPNSMKSSSRPN